MNFPPIFQVQFAPVVSATRPVVYQAMMYDMDMECHVEAYPPAAIRWIFRWVIGVYFVCCYLKSNYFKVKCDEIFQ